MENSGKKSHLKVAILIVNWNRCQDTLECLRSLQKITYPNYRIILVDNGSKDDSVTAVKAEFPTVKIIQSARNLRFAGGNNLGLRDVLDHGDDLCLLLNNDTIVAPDFLDRLVDTAMMGSNISLVGPKILYYHRPDVIWFAGGVIKPVWGYVRHYGLRQIDREEFNQPKEVSFLTGCCMLIHRKILEKVGFLDEDFYLYSEDADYCLRVKNAGYKLFYEPKARIYHKVSQSTGGSYHPHKWKHHYLSLCRLVRKHTSPLTYPLFCLNLIWELLSLPVNALLQTRRLPLSSKAKSRQ